MLAAIAELLWNLGFEICLGFGIWDLGFPIGSPLGAP
jgi:hypothetical protein